MTELFFRRVALIVVFAAGVVSIMATSYPPDVYFEEVDIQPVYRCPGTDVTLAWVLNKPGPVSVTVDDREYRVGREAQALTVAADMFDRTDPRVDVVMRIDMADADYPDIYEIRTLRHESWVNASAYYNEDADLVMNQGSSQWDRHIETTGFEIVNVRNLVCAGGEKRPRFWDVTSPSGQTFELRAGEKFERRFDPGIPAGGVWKLRPRDIDCQPLPSGPRAEINIQLWAVCRQPPKSS